MRDPTLGNWKSWLTHAAVALGALVISDVSIALGAAPLVMVALVLLGAFVVVEKVQSRMGTTSPWWDQVADVAAPTIIAVLYLAIRLSNL